MIQTIIALALAGFLLIAAEVFVPGLILGTLGTLLLIASVVVAYTSHGPVFGTVTLALVGGLSLAGFAIWLYAFPRTFIGRRITLSSSLTPGSSPAATHPLIGGEGTALSPLRPAGTALINGLRVDVVTDGSFIEAGTGVLVTLVEGSRIVVRAIPAKNQ